MLQVILALGPVGGIAHLVHRRYLERDQDRDDGDDAQKLAQRKAGPPAEGAMMSRHDESSICGNIGDFIAGGLDSQPALRRGSRLARLRRNPFLRTLYSTKAVLLWAPITVAMPNKRRQPIGSTSIEDLVRELLAEPDKWLDTKNEQLGGVKPGDLMGTVNEPVLRNLLEAIKYGSFS